MSVSAGEPRATGPGASALRLRWPQSRDPRGPGISCVRRCPGKVVQSEGQRMKLSWWFSWVTLTFLWASVSEVVN